MRRPAGARAIFLGSLMMSFNWALAQPVAPAVPASSASGNASATSPGAARAVAPYFYEPGAWKAGSWNITPQLALAAGYNDNIRLQATDTIASPFLAAYPSLTASRAIEDDHFELQWRGEWTRFTRSQQDDTMNNELSLDGQQVVDAHTAAAWRMVWQDWHESLGLARADQIAGAPAHVHDLALDLVWRHEVGAGVRFEFEPSLSYKRYLDQRLVTSEADQTSFDLTGRALETMSPDQRAGLEMRFARNRFPSGSLAEDNHGLRSLLLWQRDAPEGESTMSSGQFGVGYETRAFDQFRPGYGGLAWNVDWTWPGESNTFELASQRQALDAPSADVDEMVDEHVVASLTHQWPLAWRGSISLTLGHEHYVGALFPRDDHLNGLDLTLRRDVSRRIQLTFNVGVLQRRSLVGAFDFTRFLASVEIAAAL